MKRVLIVITVIIVLAPTALWAQGDLTLEGLAEDMAALVARVEIMEAVFADPWSPDVVYSDDGICQSPLHAEVNSIFGRGSGIHQTTADAYRSQYGTSIDPSRAQLKSISFAVETSLVYLRYEISDRIVVEKWAHCDFVGHSDWEDE